MNDGGYWSGVHEGRLSRRRALAASGAAALGAGLLAACGGDGGSRGGDKSSLVTKPVDTLRQAKRGGVMKDRTFADPPTLDILTANNPWGNAGFSVYNSLVLKKPGYLKPSEGEIAPDIAESWEYSPDGLQITLKLRQGIKFHNKPPVNGRALEMDDVLFSWNRFATKYSGRSGVANAASPSAPVLSLTAADAKTIVIKLKEPLVYTLALFVGTNGTGVYIIPKETDSSLDLRGDMIGTGAWYLANYTPSVGITLKRNAEFYDKDWALVEQVDMPIIAEYASALAQFKAGNIYSMGSYNNLVEALPEDILPIKREEARILIYEGDLKAYRQNRPFVFGWLPAGKSPFLDERIRQAISMSWDRDLYLDTFLNVSGFQAEGVPVETRWNTHLNATQEGWWLDPKGKDFGPNARYFQHDLAEAKRLLAAAGYPNGFETISSYVTGPELPATKIAPVLDGFISELGITAKVHPIDYLKEYIPLYRDGKGQHEGWAYGGTAGGATGGDPVAELASEYWSKGGSNAFRGFSTSGQNDLSGDPQVDALIERARVELDTEKRRALAFDIQRYLAKPMFSLNTVGVASSLTVAWPCLGNFRVYPGARTNYRLWVDETKPPFKGA